MEACDDRSVPPRRRRALVTGANTGIGRAIAEGLAQAGAEVLAAGRSACDETVAAITVQAAGAGRPARLRRPDGGAGHVRRSRSTSSSTTPASSAATTPSTSPRPTGTTSSTSTSRRCSSSARPSREGRCARGGGRIVNIASLLSFQGGIRVPSYTASKHGVAGLTKLLANEWAAKGINVNAIAPGYIATNNTTALREDPERSAEILARIPAGRWGEADDIAGAAVYLPRPPQLRPRRGPERRRRLACPIGRASPQRPAAAGRRHRPSRPRRLLPRFRRALRRRGDGGRGRRLGHRRRQPQAPGPARPAEAAGLRLHRGRTRARGRDAEVVEVVQDVLVAPEDPDAVLARWPIPRCGS